MENFLASRFNLDRAFVNEQMLNFEISNCVPEDLLNDFLEQEGQDVFKSIDDLKLGVDEWFVDSFGNDDQQITDMKQIISLLELGANKELMDPVVLSGAFAVPNHKVIQRLRSIVLRQRTPKRFCDLYTLDKIRNAVENRPRKLWGKLLHEGTNTILFSDNGVGKTQLSMMVADGIVKEESTIFGLEVEKSPFPRIVVYYDFEMTEPMLLKRCGFNSESNIEGLTLDEMRSRLPQFVRVDFIQMQDDLRSAGFTDNEFNKLDRVDQMFLHIECCMRKNVSVNVLFVIDNITSVCYRTEDNAVAQELMNRFVELKQEYGSRFSSVILAHTPKVPQGKPLMKEHLKGAKSLSDLADEVIGLKQSCQSEDMFYLKQFKGRVDGKDFDEDNVLIFRRFVSETGALSLEVGQTEKELLHVKTEKATQSEIDMEAERLRNRHIKLVTETFEILESLPGRISQEDRENYLFTASEISDEIFAATEERIPVRLVKKIMNQLEATEKTFKIGTDKTKKGFIIKKLD